MNRIKIIALSSFILLASCATRKHAANYSQPNQETTLAGALSSVSLQNNSAPFVKSDIPAMAESSKIETEQSIEPENQAGNGLKAASSSKKARSFSQLKAMVKNGELTMSKRDLKTLNKLDKLSKGHFNNRGDDPFEMTPTAKIIAGVGAAAGVGAMLFGSWFLGFVFIVAVLAFVCRWIGIIDF